MANNLSPSSQARQQTKSEKDVNADSARPDARKHPLDRDADFPHIRYSNYYENFAHFTARHVLNGETIMAKPATLQIKLVSTADTGYYYVTKKNPRTKPEKLELMKYDPRARKHVLFKEAKIK